ncbi:MAG: hypothetical protein ABI569_03560 [Casimicrobiaceae bacterium]
MKFGCRICSLDFDHALEQRKQAMEGRNMTIGTVDRIALAATFAAALLILAALGITEVAEAQHVPAVESLRMPSSSGNPASGARRHASIESATHGRH